MSQPDPLDLIRRQIVDLQERTTALEKTPPGQRPDGALEGLLAAGLKAVAGTVRSAAEAKAARTAEPADTPTAPTRPAVRDAVQRAAASVARAQAAAAPLFPITEPEPAASYAGRTAPRRTLPPEAPVRLWNAEHTDHLDLIGRACEPEREGTHVRIRIAQSETALVWLHGHALITDGGTAYVAWMDREWTLQGYSSTTNTGLVLDLLPIPKPPRVDQVLGRETQEDRKQLRRDFAASRPGHVTGCVECGGAPGEVHPAWCRMAAVIGQPEEPGGGSGPRIEPTLGIVDDADGEPRTYVGTVTSGLVYARPEPTTRRDALAQATHESVDEVLAVKGDRPFVRFHTADGTQARAYVDYSNRNGDSAYVEFNDDHVAHWLFDRGHETIRADWDDRTWTVTSCGTGPNYRYAQLGPLPGEPGAPDHPLDLDHVADAAGTTDEDDQ